MLWIPAAVPKPLLFFSKSNHKPLAEVVVPEHEVSIKQSNHGPRGVISSKPPHCTSVESNSCANLSFFHAQVAFNSRKYFSLKYGILKGNQSHKRKNAGIIKCKMKGAMVN